MSETSKPRLVGINHIAIEVGDIDQALDFYGKIFDFKLRAKRGGNAFIELGDQFINMMQTADPHEDRRRHFGLVVDDRSSVRERVEAAGGKLLPGRFSTPGVIGSRWSNTPISSLPRRRMSCARWALISTRTRTLGVSWPRRAWRPNRVHRGLSWRSISVPYDRRKRPWRKVF